MPLTLGGLGVAHPEPIMSTKNPLDVLRREIDGIDDAIHDLLMKRTRIIEKVRHLKRNSAIKIRPSREADILYRLIARHEGPFPRRELVRVWREIIIATLRLEGAFAVATYQPEESSAYWDLARDQYGAFSSLTGYQSVRRVVEAVRSGEATVGILPMPKSDDVDPWWRHLVALGSEAPRIVARLPFAGPGNARDVNAEALVICQVAAEPTGRDRTFFAVEAADEIGLERMILGVTEADLPATFAALWHDAQAPDTWLYLVEVDGFIADDDPRPTRFIETFERPVTRIVPLGCYAQPLEKAELDGTAVKKGTS